MLIKLNSIYFRILEVELYKQMTTCSTLVEQEQYLVDFTTIFKLSLWTTLTNKKFHRGRDCTWTFVRISKSSPGSLIFVHTCIRKTCKTIKPARIGSLDQVHLAPLYLSNTRTSIVFMWRTVRSCDKASVIGLTDAVSGQYCLEFLWFLLGKYNSVKQTTGGYSWEFLVGVCRPVLQILTLSKTKKFVISHTRSQTCPLKSIPVFRPGL